jgi:hypothetical protein
LEARITAALEAARASPDPPSIRQIARRAGMDRDRLQTVAPELYARVRQTVEADRTAARAVRRQRQLAQIDTAAARLVAAGVRLTYTGLLRASGVDRYYGFRDPVIHDLLEEWIGDPTP